MKFDFVKNNYSTDKSVKSLKKDVPLYESYINTIKEIALKENAIEKRKYSLLINPDSKFNESFLDVLGDEVKLDLGNIAARAAERVKGIYIIFREIQIINSKFNESKKVCLEARGKVGKLYTNPSVIVRGHELIDQSSITIYEPCEIITYDTLPVGLRDDQFFAALVNNLYSFISCMKESKDIDVLDSLINDLDKICADYDNYLVSVYNVQPDHIEDILNNYDFERTKRTYVGKDIISFMDIEREEATMHYMYKAEKESSNILKEIEKEIQDISTYISRSDSDISNDLLIATNEYISKFKKICNHIIYSRSIINNNFKKVIVKSAQMKYLAIRALEKLYIKASETDDNSVLLNTKPLDSKFLFTISSISEASIIEKPDTIHGMDLNADSIYDTYFNTDEDRNQWIHGFMNSYDEAKKDVDKDDGIVDLLKREFAIIQDSSIIDKQGAIQLLYEATPNNTAGATQPSTNASQTQTSTNQATNQNTNIQQSNQQTITKTTTKTPAQTAEQRKNANEKISNFKMFMNNLGNAIKQGMSILFGKLANEGAKAQAYQLFIGTSINNEELINKDGKIKDLNVWISRLMANDPEKFTDLEEMVHLITGNETDVVLQNIENKMQNFKFPGTKDNISQFFNAYFMMNDNLVEQMGLMRTNVKYKDLSQDTKKSMYDFVFNNGVKNIIQIADENFRNIDKIFTFEAVQRSLQEYAAEGKTYSENEVNTVINAYISLARTYYSIKMRAAFECSKQIIQIINMYCKYNDASFDIFTDTNFNDYTQKQQNNMNTSSIMRNQRNNNAII